MKVLQVKEYHRTIAKEKNRRAMKAWWEKKDGYSYPFKEMFYFFRTDKQGYPTTIRQRGYVTYDDTRAEFCLSKPKEVK